MVQQQTDFGTEFNLMQIRLRHTYSYLVGRRWIHRNMKVSFGKNVPSGKFKRIPRSIPQNKYFEAMVDSFIFFSDSKHETMRLVFINGEHHLVQLERLQSKEKQRRFGAWYDAPTK